MLSRKEIKTLKYWTWTGPSCSPPRSTSTYPSLWHLANERERERSFRIHFPQKWDAPRVQSNIQYYGINYKCL